MPGNALDWTDVATLQAMLRLPGGTDATILQSLITQASDHLASRIGRVVIQSAVTERYDGRDNSTIVLREFPVASIASVIVDGVTIPASNGSTTSGWYQSGTRSVSLIGNCFTRGTGNVVITYTAGYLLASLPPRYTRACLRLCMHWYRELDRIGQTSKSLGGAEVAAFAISIPKDLEDFVSNEQDVVPA